MIDKPESAYFMRDRFIGIGNDDGETRRTYARTQSRALKDKLVRPTAKTAARGSAPASIPRGFYTALLAIIHIVILLLFVMRPHETAVTKAWSRGIIASHAVVIVFLALFLLFALRLRRAAQPNTAMRILQYAVVAFIMAAGIAIVAIDQLVTTNITPFILISVICGSVFLIRPLVSAVIFLVSYAAYYVLIGLAITDQNILLSNRVNGIIAVGIGFLLSYILWRYNYKSIVQQRRIESHQKQLEQLAYYDSLTDLPNRRMLEQLIKQELAAWSGTDTTRSLSFWISTTLRKSTIIAIRRGQPAQAARRPAQGQCARGGHRGKIRRGGICHPDAAHDAGGRVRRGG